jgi:hypothetical protein
MLALTVAAVIISVTVGYPTATLAARLSVEQLVPRWKHSPPSCVRAAAIATTVTVISAATALFVDDLGVIVEIVGAIGASRHSHWRAYLCSHIGALDHDHRSHVRRCIAGC